MQIPHRTLSPDALQSIIEDFVTRDGTDYGEAEIPLATKVAQVKKLLDTGACFIIYDAELATVDIVAKEQLLLGGLDAEE
jgi:uncharacterized protein YheU (UPF0270 family)